MARDVPDRFAVAFSLAGEQRQIVLAIAQEVEDILGRSAVFYDDWYAHWIAGQDSDLLLQSIYAQQADLVVVCVSEAYGDKPWTRTEHRAVRARLQQGGTARDRLGVLPIRVGDGEVEGVLFNQIVPDVRGMTPAEAAELIVARLNLARGTAGDVKPAVAQWPDDAPELHWPMADHSAARAAFARLLCEGSTERALLVRGVSETGKSHMSKQMVRNAGLLPGVISGRFDFKGTTNIGIEAFAQPLGIEEPAGRSLNEQLAAIFTELRRRAQPTLLVFDTYEAAAGEVKDRIESVLLPQLVAARWLRVVITGQSVPKRGGSTWESVAAGTLTLQLPAPEDWLAYGRANRDELLTLEFVTQVHQLGEGRASVLASLLGPRS
ncbi:TIR domain-containing protein [Actinoplanes sp. TBRC 11911]|uniref:TIR domain-containing protein n=1 Tax=Actinoplanes sp. TBRC 11911 TaxID=2729386 RepID=UPI00145D3A17|nr:TIR domain-containing protein [Actinoplanes sp. TBRC 11911]NMO52310.1 TIR domain-containing protein [Actinoplanes sp. TBRC 11911]